MTNKRAAPAPYVQPYRYPAPNIPLAAIRRFARQIAERFQPEKIILFGSYAYGRPHNESKGKVLYEARHCTMGSEGRGGHCGAVGAGR
jgi:hypothetical protein